MDETNTDVVEYETKVVTIDEGKREQLELEYEEVKANLQKLTEVNENAVEAVSALAKSAQHHLTWMAYAAVVKAANETQKELANVLSRKQTLFEIGGRSDEPRNVTNNNMLVTTTDVLDMIKKKNGIQE